MSSAPQGVRLGRRAIRAFPAAALAVGTAGLFLTAPSAHADGTSQPQGLPAAASHAHHPAGQAELKARIAGVLRAGAHATPRSTSTGAAKSTTSTATAKSTGSGASGSSTTPMIIGGTTTTFAKAPWMVQLWYYDDRGTTDTSDDIGFFCGGTVIAPSKILTAAHCVHGFDWYDHGSIVSGTDQLPTSNPDGTVNLYGGSVSAVAAQWNHPSYDDATTDNDAAVLTVDQFYASPLSASAKPLPITSSSDTASYAPGNTATVYGWGRTSSTSQDISQQLKTATLPIDSDATCTSWDPVDFVPGHMVCAGDPASGSDAGTITPCNGDSGGPLVENGKIVGIVSWGVEDCVASGAHSVFTKVSRYTAAIDQRLDDASATGDNLGDLFARTPGGAGYVYASKGTSLGARQSLSGSWSGLNLVRQADMNRDWAEDLVVRTTGGHLWFDNAADGSWHDIGGGWNAMRSLTVPGDLTGDGNPDLFATDGSGNAYVYPGTGKGTFGARVRVGGGWQIYGSVVYGKGDLNDDGRVDMVARDSSGTLWLYRSTGSAYAPWATRVRIGSGWNTYNAFAAVGDMTGDGRADLIGRDSAGKLWLYKGTGRTSAPYAPRVQLGYGYQAYNLFG